MRQLARLTKVSLARVHGILKKHLQLRKINARWIPHLLTDEQKRTCVASEKKTTFKNVSKIEQKGFRQFSHR